MNTYAKGLSAYANINPMKLCIKNGSKICVLSLAVGDQFRYTVRYGIQTRIEYCNKHKYDYIEDESVVDWSRPLQWAKILLILKYLPEYDYVVWIDADTLIMNPEVRLEERIDRLLGPEKEVMYTTGHSWVNNGIIFVKNTQFMREYFQEVYNHTDQVCREQGSMDYLWRENWKNCREKVVVVENQREFNSFWDNYEWGDFIIHFPGCGEPNRPERCLERMMRMYCPIRMVEDDEKTLEYRLNWLRKNHAKKAIGYRVYVPLFRAEISTDVLSDIKNTENL